MLIHLPDETPIIEVMKLAARLKCEIEYSSASVLRFNKREADTRGDIKNLPSQQQKRDGFSVRSDPR